MADGRGGEAGGDETGVRDSGGDRHGGKFGGLEVET